MCSANPSACSGGRETNSFVENFEGFLNCFGENWHAQSVSKSESKLNGARMFFEAAFTIKVLFSIKIALCRHTLSKCEKNPFYTFCGREISAWETCRRNECLT